VSDARTPAGAALLRLYPAAWRARYGDEMLALLEDRRVGWRDRLDLVRGAVDAHWLAPRSAATMVGAALLAGAAWTVAAAATLGEPVLPDWPGYLDTTLPLGAVAVGAGLVATYAEACRYAERPGRILGWATRLALVGQLLWAVALAVAVLGGPYGAITALAAASGGVGLVVLGLAALRVGGSWTAVALVVMGGASLVPSVAAWLVAGATWTTLGLVAWWRRAAAVRPPAIRT
jgi:hypothetical protein